MCTGHSSSTIIPWYRATSSQCCSGRLAASGYVCILICMCVPSHFTSANARPGYVAAAFCGSSSQAAFLSGARSLPPPPRTRLRHVPRAGPLPCAPLALVVLLPLHVFCLRCRPEALRRRHRRIRQARPVDHDERAHLPRFSVRAPRRRRRPVAAALAGARAPRFAATPLSECNGYAGLIRVLLIIPCALSLCMRKRAAFVLPSFTEPRLIAFLSIN
ncbi:hypothetical protein B0H14DRAFT_866737 [Mycena olivaceomarginata]|nr:hypothetical protein B0H14DRAFT_866737 [Mycena olivaceomarginata]